MPNVTVEIARIRLRDGVDEQQLVAASNRFQHEFLNTQPGFLKRELLRLDERNYADLVHWRSVADADAIMEKIAGSPACHAYFSVMEMDAADPAAGVTHYTSLASYG